MFAYVGAYVSQLISGTAAPLWPHFVLIIGSVMAGAAVGAGIIFESPEYSKKVHHWANRAVIIGVIIESCCTVSLFVFDEAISDRQQEKIIALETRLAPRTLEPDQKNRIADAVKLFPDTAFDVGVSQDPDSRNLLGQILPVLATAHWDRQAWGGPGVGLAAYVDGKAIAFLPLDGLIVEYNPASEAQFGKAANALAAALTKEGLDTKTEVLSEILGDRIRLLVGAKE